MPNREADDALLTSQDALADVSLDDFTDGPVNDVARRLRDVRRLQATLKDVAAALELKLVGDMEAETLDVAHVGRVERKTRQSSRWADEDAAERMREDIGTHVATQLSTDIATGEVDQGRRNVILGAIRELWEVLPAPSSMKVGGQRRFGLDIEHYRTFSYNHYVTVTEEAEDA